MLCVCVCVGRKRLRLTWLWHNNRLNNSSNQTVFLGNFQLSVESNPGLLCFCFTSLCDWS